jgi:hypothetical protein
VVLYGGARGGVRSPDGGAGFFVILAGVLRGVHWRHSSSSSVWTMFSSRLDKTKDFGLTLSEAGGRGYPAITIAGAGCADGLAIVTNTVGGAQSLLRGLGRAADDVGLHINAGRAKLICYNRQAWSPHCLGVL